MPAWFDIARQVTGILWPMAIMVAGITRSERISWPSALLLTLIGAVPTTGLMVIFIR